MHGRSDGRPAIWFRAHSNNLHPPSSSSSFVLQGNSNYHTLVNSVPSTHCSPTLSLLACSMRTASGTMPMWVLQMCRQPCWILLAWVCLIMFYSRTLVNSPVLSLQQTHRIDT